MSGISIRPEQPADYAAISGLIDAAFAGKPFASGTEAAIVVALRSAGAVTLGLVGESDGRVVAQVVFSPVTIDGRASGWHALGPVAVEPALQGQGFGAVLIREGLEQLRGLGSAGCVLTGSAYYRRFGFENSERLRVAGYDPKDFLVLPFGDGADGEVAFHPAFG